MNMIGYKLNQRNFRRNFLYSIGAIVLSVFIVVIGTSCLFLANGENIQIDGHMMLLTVANIFLELSKPMFFVLYSYFLLSIRIRFCLLNMALRNAIRTPNTIARLYGGATSDEIIELLDSLSALHGNLTNGVKIVNDYYAFYVRILKFTFPYSDNTNFIIISMSIPQIMCFLTCIFSSCVGCAYTVYKELSVISEIYKYRVVIALQWLLQDMVYLLLLLHITVHSCNEVDIDHSLYNIQWLLSIDRDGQPLLLCTSWCAVWTTAEFIREYNWRILFGVDGMHNNICYRS